jgi:hypothetical protein
MCDCIATVFQVLLYLTAAALPAVGLIRVYVRAKIRADKFKALGGPTFGGFDAAMSEQFLAIERAPIVAINDAVLIGAGLLAGTIASIWSLFT